ncbi:hypothetical protein RZS08_50240, partial [Arthrospira platensis SPKY1]|nr:hypothetical protein [Arthrospira platensis SPKY1]
RIVGTVASERPLHHRCTGLPDVRQHRLKLFLEGFFGLLIGLLPGNALPVLLTRCHVRGALGGPPLACGLTLGQQGRWQSLVGPVAGAGGTPCARLLLGRPVLAGTETRLAIPSGEIGRAH